METSGFAKPPFGPELTVEGQAAGEVAEHVGHGTEVTVQWTKR